MEQTRQSQFLEWLSKSVSPAQLSELYQALIDLEEILSSHRYLHHLPCALMETTDASSVETLYKDLSGNKRFMCSYKCGLKLSLIRYYARYCRENASEPAQKQKKKTISSDDELIDRLKRNNIGYADNRSKGGALWINETPKTDGMIRVFAAKGMRFNYSESKRQWWTSDPTPKSTTKSKDTTSVTIKTIQHTFIGWLRRQYSDSVEIYSIYGIARKIHAMLLTEGKAPGLFGIQGIDSIRMSAKELRTKKDFVQLDRKENGLWTKTLDCYLRFAETELQDVLTSTASKATPAITEGNQSNVAYSDGRPQKGETHLDPALLEILQDEQFDDLRKALVSKGIYKFEDFKRLNLWVFMNQNGLYSIGQRQIVYSTIRRILGSGDTTKAKAQWKIVTLEQEYMGTSPAEALMEYCRAIAAKYPLRFRVLIGERMNSSGLVPLMKARMYADDPCLDSPKVYFNSRMKADEAKDIACWIASRCRYNDTPQAIETIVAEPQKPAETAEISPKQPDVPVNSPKQVSPLQEQVEKLVLAADLAGLTLDRLYAQIPSVTMVALKQIRDTSPKLVDMGDRLIHVDAFVDLEEAAEKLKEILEKLLAKNNGYVSLNQLWEYVRAEMHMFLNDNDISDDRSVYCIARHLFEKTNWQGTHYVFTGGCHISRDGKEVVTSNFDVINMYAREHNGFFRYDNLVEYLQKVGISTGNLRGQMHIGGKPYFFYYSSDEIISAESMGIDKAWLNQVEKALARLFEDAGDHVVLRTINPIWYEQLPTLPGYITWTPLLLQYVLMFYGKDVGAKTIGAQLNQRYDVLHAMVVSRGSVIQTFADCVIAFLVDNNVEQRQFEAEELRSKLVNGGLIAGNELIWNMPKAIGSDPRFAWNMSGGKVKIQV